MGRCRLLVAVLIPILIVFFFPVRAHPQSSADLTPSDDLTPSVDLTPSEIYSLGQPPKTELRWGPQFGYGFDNGEFASRLFVDLIQKNPLGFGSLLDATFEGAIGTTGPNLDAAIGGYLGFPLFHLGIEYRFHEQTLPLVLTSQFPLKRGGLFGFGEQFRFDYRPSNQEFLLGLSFRPPSKPYRMSRPRNKEIAMPIGSVTSPPDTTVAEWSDELEIAVSRIEHSIAWLDRMTCPRFQPGEEFSGSAEELRDHISLPGHRPDQEDSTYHAALAGAFAAICGADTVLGNQITAIAEGIIWSQVIVPFNREFARLKRPSDAGGLCQQAAASFADSISNHSNFDGMREEYFPLAAVHAKEVFRRVLAGIEAVSINGRVRWEEKFLFWGKRGQLAWLPLNLGLRPSAYDTQREWDNVLASLTEYPFTKANTIEYLMFEQFHVQFKKMLRETKIYQATMIHDFRGRDANGDTDIYGWDIVADGYIEAFAQAVQELEDGTRDQMPQFHLFLDAHYYHANKSRQIMTFLENLYDPSDLKLKSKEIQNQVTLAQKELRAAIDGSSLFSDLPDEDLREIFKVNVNITNPFDPAFLFDITMRDHRKIAFRDVFEADPSSGVGMFTGQGIGSHYNGASWEDRSVMVRGSSLIQLKDETRELFLSQGFKEEEVPEVLRFQELPDNYDELCSDLEQKGWNTPVSLPMNATGYGIKSASVLKAAMYNLAPSQSFLLTFDSLWISEFWAGMMVGAALRGVSVLPIAPSPENAPSSATPTLYYLRENLDRMFQAQNYFSQQIEDAGGILRVGIYSHNMRIDDFRKRGEAFLTGRQKYEFLNEIFPFHPSVPQTLLKYMESLEEVSIVELRLRAKPKLHLKNQLLGTREALEVFRLEQWSLVMLEHLRIRRNQLSGRVTEGLSPKLLENPAPGDTTGKSLVEAFAEAIEDCEECDVEDLILTFTVGSHNQNPRSLLLDGESLVVISGVHSLVSVIDFMFLTGISSWPETQEEFDDLFPIIKPSAPSKWFYGLLKDLL